ncbi:MAG: putative lipid II flippase FtsW [Clostridia bacterium]|nr:putative lipid II flippase FtsW [Clostridia bacterium]
MAADRNRISTSSKPTKDNSSAEKYTKKLQQKQKRIVAGEIDYTFLVIVILIVAAGLVVLLSASAPAGLAQEGGNSYSFFIKQAVCATLGFVGMWFVSRINYERYKAYIPFAMAVCVLLLILVLIPGLGRKINGSRRWLNTPIIPVQPSEFVKPIIAMFFALMIEKGNLNLKTFGGNLPFLCIIGVVVGLMLCETHLSGAIVIAGIALVVMIAGGTPIKPMLIALCVIAPVGIFLVSFNEVRWERITGFLDPFADMQDTTYQISQALYAIGSGRIFGLGLGQSVQKYTYLPEPYNDFIFAIICEELGLVGAVIIMGLFVLLIFRGVRIAMNAPDVYSTLTAIGIVSQIAIQTILNIAVATSSVPNTGVALPFFSYGGTSILTLLIEMGVLLNISRRSKNAL